MFSVPHADLGIIFMRIDRHKAKNKDDKAEPRPVKTNIELLHTFEFKYI